MVQVQEMTSAAIHALGDTTAAVVTACQQTLQALARSPGCLLAALGAAAHPQDRPLQAQLQGIARQPPAKQLSAGQQDRLVQLMFGLQGGPDRCARTLPSSPGHDHCSFQAEWCRLPSESGQLLTAFTACLQEQQQMEAQMLIAVAGLQGCAGVCSIRWPGSFLRRCPLFHGAPARARLPNSCHTVVCAGAAGGSCWVRPLRCGSCAVPSAGARSHRCRALAGPSAAALDSNSKALPASCQAACMAPRSSACGPRRPQRSVPAWPDRCSWSQGRQQRQRAGHLGCAGPCQAGGGRSAAPGQPARQPRHLRRPAQPAEAAGGRPGCGLHAIACAPVYRRSRGCACAGLAPAVAHSGTPRRACLPDCCLSAQRQAPVLDTAAAAPWALHCTCCCQFCALCAPCASAQAAPGVTLFQGGPASATAPMHCSWQACPHRRCGAAAKGAVLPAPDQAALLFAFFGALQQSWWAAKYGGLTRHRPPLASCTFYALNRKVSWPQLCGALLQRPAALAASAMHFKCHCPDVA